MDQMSDSRITQFMNDHSQKLFKSYKSCLRGFLFIFGYHMIKEEVTCRLSSYA